jgi:hypothetical protein
MKLHNYTQVDIFKKTYQNEENNETLLDQSNGVVSVAKGPT